MYKAKLGPMTSVLQDATSPAKERKVPEIFGEESRKVYDAIRGNLQSNEIRAMASNAVAAPTLSVSKSPCRRILVLSMSQLLLELEAQLHLVDRPHSLVDDLLSDFITNKGMDT